MFRIKEEMRRATAADEVIQGVSQDKGRITATEIQAQMNQASRRFSTKLTNLEDEGYAQLGRIIFKMVQIFVDQKIAVRMAGQRVYAGGTSTQRNTQENLSQGTAGGTTKAVKAEGLVCACAPDVRTVAVSQSTRVCSSIPRVNARRWRGEDEETHRRAKDQSNAPNDARTARTRNSEPRRSSIWTTTNT